MRENESVSYWLVEEQLQDRKSVWRVLAVLMLMALWESSSALVKFFGAMTEDKFRSTMERARCHAKMTQWLFFVFAGGGVSKDKPGLSRSLDAMSSLLSHEREHSNFWFYCCLHHRQFSWCSCLLLDYFRYFKCSIGEGALIINGV